MKNTSILKEKLVQKISKLPANQLQEALDFINFLLSKKQNGSKSEPENDLDPALDPILKFIGGVSYGSLAKNIDTELYGRTGDY